MTGAASLLPSTNCKDCAPVDDAAGVQEVQPLRHLERHGLSLPVPVEFVCTLLSAVKEGCLQVAPLQSSSEYLRMHEWPRAQDGIPVLFSNR